MTDNLSQDVGNTFPPTLNFVGKIVFAAGVLLVFFGPLVGLFGMVVGAYLGFSKNVVILNPVEQTYRDAITIFGIKFGKAKTYKNYPFLSVLRTKVSSGVYSQTNRHAKTSTELYYDVYFLSQSHRERVLIRRFKSNFEAKESAQELGKILSKSVVMYSPKVSAASLAKR